MITIGYSGGLVSHLTDPGLKPPLDSIAGVARSGMPLNSISPAIRNALVDSSDADVREILRRQSIVPDLEANLAGALSGESVAMESRAMMEFVVKRDFSDR